MLHLVPAEKAASAGGAMLLLLSFNPSLPGLQALKEGAASDAKPAGLSGQRNRKDKTG